MIKVQLGNPTCWYPSLKVFNQHRFERLKSAGECPKLICTCRKCRWCQFVHFFFLLTKDRILPLKIAFILNCYPNGYRFKEQSIYFDVKASPQSYYKAFKKISGLFDMEEMRRFSRFTLRATFISCYMSLHSPEFTSTSHFSPWTRRGYCINRSFVLNILQWPCCPPLPRLWIWGEARIVSRRVHCWIYSDFHLM